MKRLAICCDGTWCTPDQENDGIPVPTNVVRLFNAIDAENQDGSIQRKYYHPGVGTEGSWLEKLAGGSSGVGLGKNIMSAYKWLGDNYESGDRIFLFGFSRGAYTVRSLAGMIAACGLLDLDGISEKEAWKRVEAAFKRCYRVPPKKRKAGWYRDWPFHIGDDNEQGVLIHFLGVWDTVGALGIPDDLALLNMFDPDRKHSFHDTKLSARVTNGFHAVAIDEWRASFTPTLWTDVEERPEVHQVWFPGSHSDVGGGYPEKGLSDGALLWMIEAAEKISDGLTFRQDMKNQIDSDSQDVLHDSYRGFFSVLPTHPRTIPLLRSGANDKTLHMSAIDRFKQPPIAQADYHPTKLLKPGQSTDCSIYARDPWNETGIYLEKGKIYLFEATGEWVDRTIVCNPDGTSDNKFQASEIVHLAGTLWGKVEDTFKWLTGNESADFKATKRVEKAPWFCLMGAIANSGNPDEDGTPAPLEIIKIGESCTHTPRDSGYLYCFANDAWNFYENNRGSVVLTVTRQ